MKLRIKFLLALNFLIALFILSLFLFKSEQRIQIKETFKIGLIDKDNYKIALKPICSCDESVFVLNRSLVIFAKYKNEEYKFIPEDTTLTCDLYHSLKRGPGQKIISYSLYGDNQRYFKLLPHLVETIKKFYPDFLMRIYYDYSVNKSIICDLECKYSNVDFCNVHTIPKSFKNLSDLNDYGSINSMMWRFLASGDTFVDLFMSRDTDSLIHERERDAVYEWIVSDKAAHIMRDNPFHGVLIPGGMWGFKNYLNRNIAKNIFLLINHSNEFKQISSKDVRARDADQGFLSMYVYRLISKSSLIHDSFHCNFFPNGRPFPTQRKGNCFVGSISFCDETAKFYSCPVDCRPKHHLDWLFC